MNVATGQKPLVKYEGFKGLWSRGAYETCPPDHLTDCHNCSFPGPKQLTIREPITASTTIGGRAFTSYFVSTPVNTGARLLTLDTGGVFRDETAVTTLGTITGTAGAIPDDFCALNIFGRTYISFKLLGKALPGGSTYYYDGTNFVAIAGAGPVAGPVLAQANPGIVDIGVHGVAISFQSRNGYLSPPSPITNITSTGTNDIELSVIPTGPAGTVARVILMTQANQTLLWFVPGGIINDNVTTIATINIHDTALIVSADYLNNILPSVPSCSAIRFYSGRLVLVGLDVASITVSGNTVQTIPDNIFLSNQQSPETFDSVNNVVSLPQDYGINTCNTGLVINSVLYLIKPNGTFSVSDNGNNPGTWTVNVVDTALGAWDNGTTLFASSMSGADASGTSFLATRRGIMLFNGSYSMVPLTYKIQSLWNLLLTGKFYNIQLAHDVWNRRIYAAVPLTPPFNNNFVVNTNGVNVTRVSGPTFFPGMVGMYVSIAGANYKISGGNFTANPQTLVLGSSAGIQAGVALTCEYPGNTFLSGASGNNIILMGDYSDGLDPMNIKWSTWSSDIFSPYLTGAPAITKMSVENFTLAYAGSTTAIYQLAFCNGGTTIYKIITFPSGLNQVITQPTPQDQGNHSCLQYFSIPAGGNDDGVYTFTLLKFGVYSNGILYPSALTKNRGSQTFLRSFSISTYSIPQDFDRLININSESLTVLLQNDLNNPGGANGFLQPTSLTVYGKLMWQMRPALTQNA